MGGGWQLHSAALDAPAFSACSETPADIADRVRVAELVSTGVLDTLSDLDDAAMEANYADVVGDTDMSVAFLLVVVLVAQSLVEPARRLLAHAPFTFGAW